MTMCIVMSMNIYITKANEELLNKVRDKQSMSGLINKLLDDYRAGKGQDLFPSVINLKENKDGTVSPKDPSKPASFVRRLGDNPLNINFPDTNPANGVCKIHGLPLDARGRCLQKGCKYA